MTISFIKADNYYVYNLKQLMKFHWDDYCLMFKFSCNYIVVFDCEIETYNRLKIGQAPVLKIQFVFINYNFYIT